MASYRNINMDFWTDSKVVDDFTPEDRYFYLYAVTNPHTNLCGCYEISLNQMARETGYNTDTITRLVERFHNVHKVLEYCPETKEILLYNWCKYNWSASPKLDKPLLKDIASIKSNRFKEYVTRLYKQKQAKEPYECGLDTVSIPYPYGTDTTVSVSVSVSDTVSVSDKEKKASKKSKPTFHKYGEYGRVLLTDEQYDRLVADLGKAEADRCIAYIDMSAQGNNNKNGWSDWNLVVRRCHREGWGLKQQPKYQKQTKADELDDFYRMSAQWAEGD